MRIFTVERVSGSLLGKMFRSVRTRSSRDDRANRRSEAGTREVYAEEEVRRREGTDDL